MYVGVISVVFIKPIFMHDPIRFLSMGSSSLVKDKSLPQSDSVKATVYDLVAASGLPETGGSCAISSSPRRIFFVLVTEEVPIVLGC